MNCSLPLIALCALVCAACTAHATSIVILRGNDTVYVGADSWRSYRGAGSSGGASVCKIFAAGPFLFVASGLTYADGEQVSQFGVEAGQASATIGQALERFRANISGFLARALAARRQVESSPRAGLVLEAAYIAVDRGVSTVAIEWFRTASDPAHPGVLTDRRTYASRLNGRYEFLFLGKRAAIDRAYPGRYPWVRGDTDAVAVIRRLIGIEIAQSPGTTAPPIDIAQLTSTGVRWLDRKPGCELRVTSQPR